MDSPCAVFGDCSFSHLFGSIMRTNTHADTQTDAAKRLTHATVVGVSDKVTFCAVTKYLDKKLHFTCNGVIFYSFIATFASLIYELPAHCKINVVRECIFLFSQSNSAVFLG